MNQVDQAKELSSLLRSAIKRMDSIVLRRRIDEVDTVRAAKYDLVCAQRMTNSMILSR